MTPTQKKILVALLILLVLALLLWWFLRPRASSDQTPAITPTPVGQIPVLPSGETPIIPGSTPPPAQPETAAVIAERNVGRFSMQFAERYGSYSTETNYQNFRDLEPMMTTKMNTETNAFVAAQPPAATFYGVTTRSISANVETQTDTSAVVVVSTQREEIRGSSAARVYNQDLRMTLVKVGGEWLVDSAVWVE